MLYRSSCWSPGMKRTYENKKIRVFWDSEKCIHSGNCLLGLPQVFNPQSRPWVDIDAADAEEIRKCIENCPSRALTCEMLDEETKG